MTEYSRIAKGSFTASGTSAVVVLPFKPDFVEIFNYTNIAAVATANKTTRAWWDASLIVSNNNPTMLQLYAVTTAASIFDTITNTNANPGINAFSGGLSLQFGPSQQIVSATKAIPTVFTVTAHGYQVGDVVLLEGLYQTSTTGMPQMAGIPFEIIAVTTNTFTVGWDSSGSNYAILTGSPVGSTVKKVLYPYLYFPGAVPISLLTRGSTTRIGCTLAHQMQVGQEVAIRMPTTWGTVELNSLPNVQIPGSPMYGYVINVVDELTVDVNINSTSFTAFNLNQTISGTPGRTFAQLVAVGDVNTGGVQISSGSPLYPSPQYTTALTLNNASTINGPAIIGAFVNNTSQGFTIGSGFATNNGAGATTQIMAASDVIEWRAFLHDYSKP